MSEATIRVSGVKELQKALRQVDKALGAELRKGLNEVADIVVQAARPLMPRKTGALQDSLKPGSTQRTAAIKFGGTKAPYGPWIEFGGHVGRNRSVSRPFVPGGRTIYPTLARKRPEIIQKIDDVVERLAKRAGFEQHGKV